MSSSAGACGGACRPRFALFEDRNRAVAGQGLRIGNDRLDELADELMQDSFCRSSRRARRLASTVLGEEIEQRRDQRARCFEAAQSVLSERGTVIAIVEGADTSV